MASSFAWVSVLVKRGLKVVKERTIFKWNWSDTFEEFLSKLNEEFAVATVAQIVISNSECELVDEIKELRSSYAIVAPICFFCKDKGKEPYCRMVSKVPKRTKSVVYVVYFLYMYLKVYINFLNEIHISFSLPTG